MSTLVDMGEVGVKIWTKTVDVLNGRPLRYVSRVTKMNLGSIPDPWGPQELRVWQVEAELCIFNLNS